MQPMRPRPEPTSRSSIPIVQLQPAQPVFQFGGAKRRRFFLSAYRPLFFGISTRPSINIPLGPAEPATEDAEHSPSTFLQRPGPAPF
jgi:hypothetical protein